MSWEKAIEVALQAKAKKLVLFHHDTEHDDTFLQKIEKKCQRLLPNASYNAREGKVVTL